MRAVILDKYVDPSEEDLEIKEVDIPVCKAGMVLVKVKVAAMNPIDYKVISGQRAGRGWPFPTPFIPGYDLSGVVHKVGKGVENFCEGDAVFACNWGSNKDAHINNHADKDLPVAGAFAEYCLIPSSKLSKIPTGVSHEEAAAVALVGLTALHSLQRAVDGVFENKKLLILGGSGGVGYIACQIAKLKGSTVFTTCSSRTLEYVKGTGVDKIINYNETNWEEMSDLKGVDAVFDTIGEKDVFMKSKSILKENGNFITIASVEAGTNPTAHLPLKFASLVTLRNDPLDQRRLAEWVATKKIHVSVDKKFPFTIEGIKDAFTAQMSGKSMGKNILMIEEEIKN